nr:tryptophan-rich sensory protein [bacterium]
MKRKKKQHAAAAGESGQKEQKTFAWKPWLWALLLVGIPAAAAALVTDTHSAWYTLIQKPAFQPPAPVFAIVWGALYVLLYVVALLLFMAPPSRDKHTALRALGVQLGLNLVWTAVFFRLYMPAAALFILVGMLGLCALNIIYQARVRPQAAWLMIPYVLWLCFATVINYTIVLLN